MNNRRRVRISSIFRTAVLVVLMLSFLSQSVVMAEQLDYTIEDGTRVPIPKTYDVEYVIYDLGEYGFLNQADDLFIDDKGILYVADTGNNRIIKMDKKGKVLGVFTGPQDKPFKNPSGVFVDKLGDIFVADTGNSRILHLTPEGEFIEQFVRPESELLSDDLTFSPSKVYVNNTGMIYVIKSQSFMSIDANNRFNGFVGQTEVGFDFAAFMLRLFGSAEQKQRTAKRLPASYSNFVIDKDGIIYAVTLNTKTDQIRKINSIGKNIYPRGFYGETSLDASNKVQQPLFVDIAVDDSGIVSVLEQRSGKIYQYDQDGNLLTAFGGKGKYKGVFDLPSSLVVDDEGKIYVLDKKLNNIQVFAPTRFIQLVKKAVTLYGDGRYEESADLWQEVLKIDANYNLAHKGMGKVYIKEGKYLEAMEEYKLINDRVGYSEAFAEYRHDLFRDNFTFVVVAIVAVISLIVFMVSKIKPVADRIWHEGV